jgi:hypothetical protein
MHQYLTLFMGGRATSTEEGCLLIVGVKAAGDAEDIQTCLPSNAGQDQTIPPTWKSVTNHERNIQNHRRQDISVRLLPRLFTLH